MKRTLIYLAVLAVMGKWRNQRAPAIFGKVDYANHP